MAYTSANTNMTASTGLTPGMQTYYNRELLRTFEPELVHLQFGDEHRMPENSGLVMNMRKIIPLEANTNTLSEGEPGESVMLTETEVTVKLEQYGEYARCTDKLDLSHLDMNILRKTKLFGDAGARSIDAVVREELATCTNVIYAGGKTSRSALTSADKLTTKELRKAVRKLKKAHAQTFGGYYIAIVGPDTFYDLQDDETFVAVSRYQDKEAVYTGEIGRLFGCRIVETTEAKVFEGAGASGADVASVIVLGQYAYGYTSFKGAKPRVIVKPAGSAGTSDPLDQISTVGWKMDGFGVKMLQPEYAVRIECGFTA
ncbi:MAG: N4-gp56 family major capsid protein [Clostridiales bacterium]|nr:N4-gp56 family major capsid protein [Clostridiales bacterium]MCI7703466.1 N4-gp56 family major capsid protein [Clostridiales bacterium]MDY3764551.1 N4-gp56 family major capsid protein [Candidatus Ventricola sp.]MDY4542226.1 N4-gp56 family major capsid protein [Candidatus Ventricola sp.]MDY4854911.1 N4-gp56 family major capsid protein [Candidatus Ventricola sp.]